MDFDPQIDLSNYTKIESIGQGAFGKVFKIKDNNTGTMYAAKILSNSLSSFKKSENLNLLRELNIMAQIDHPNIVKFIGYSPIDFKNKDKPVIVTELLTKGTLSDVIEQERRSLSFPLWDDTRKLICIYGIASAMNFLHSHEIIHRDLKPSNVLMDESLYPKVADFGLSKNIDSQDSLNVQSTIGTKGTPIYMAPEIYSNCTYTKACDVYAFAMIVFEIMSNEIPFKEFQVFQVFQLYDKVTKGYRPTIPKSIPQPYKILIECCWEQNPEKRPTFEQILEVLKKNKGFITNLVDKDEYLDYVDYVEEYQATFDKNKKIRSLEERKQLRKEKIQEKVEINEKTEINRKVGICRPRPGIAIPNSDHKTTIKDKIAMFSNINVMGAPADESKLQQDHLKFQSSNIDPTPKVVNGINEKKAIFENKPVGQDTKDDQNKFTLRDQNLNRVDINSYSPSSAKNMMKRESPLTTREDNKIIENETKEIPLQNNRNSANYNKYKISLIQKIQMFNKPLVSSSDNQANKKDSV